MAVEGHSRFEYQTPRWLKVAWNVVRHPNSLRERIMPILFDRESGMWLRLDEDEDAVMEILADLLEQH